MSSRRRSEPRFGLAWVLVVLGGCVSAPPATAGSAVDESKEAASGSVLQWSFEEKVRGFARMESRFPTAIIRRGKAVAPLPSAPKPLAVSFEVDGVRKEFDRFRTCGRPEFGFIRLRCESCHSEHVLPFACKSRVVCSSCAARRTHDRDAHLMAHVSPDGPVRQWVLSPPSELVPLLAVRPKVLTTFVRSFVDGVSAEMKARRGSGASERLHTGAVAFIQRFAKTLGLFAHVHVVFVEGVYVEADGGRFEFREAGAPDEEMVFEVARRVFTRLERFLKREGYLDPTEGDAPGALDRRWMRAAREPPVLPSRPRLVPTSGSELPGGFSIHAGVRIEGDDREGREQLLRYAARPAFSEVQLSLLGGC